MSVAAITAVFALRLSPTEKVVALALADHADPAGGNIRPSISRVARMASISERTVQRVIKRLCESGTLELVAAPGHHLAATYRLVMGDKLTPKNASWVTDLRHDRPFMGDNEAQIMGDIAVSPEPIPGTTEPTPEPKPERKAVTTSDGACATVGLEAPAAPKTMAVWTAYREAYEHRYTSVPVRNAKINGQLSRLIDRLGAVEAPEVARFYVGSNATLYVRAGHAVDLLLRDCEKLRTEWFTGKRIMERDARGLDERQSRASMWQKIIEDNRAKNGTVEHGV